MGDIIIEHFKKLHLRYPPSESPEMLTKAREILMNE